MPGPHTGEQPTIPNVADAALDLAARERALLMLNLALEASRAARPGDTAAVALGRLADHLTPDAIAPGAWRRCLAHASAELEALLALAGDPP